jgi:hypothetical protein
MKITDFKVGDRIKVVGCNTSMVHNECGQVDEITNDTVRVQFDRDSIGHYYFASYMVDYPISALKKIEQKPSSAYKFKKGDRVCRTRMSNYSSEVPSGSTGVVLEDKSKVPYVRWDNKKLNKEHNDALSMHQDDMEFIGRSTTPDILLVPPDMEKTVGSLHKYVDGIASMANPFHSLPPISFSDSVDALSYGLTTTKIKPNKKTIMSTLTKFAKKLFAPEVVTLIDAGFIDDCGSGLTGNGKEALLVIIYEEKKAELVKKAEEVLAERKAAEAKN